MYNIGLASMYIGWHRYLLDRKSRRCSSSTYRNTIVLAWGIQFECIYQCRPLSSSSALRRTCALKEYECSVLDAISRGFCNFLFRRTLSSCPVDCTCRARPAAFSKTRRHPVDLQAYPVPSPVGLQAYPGPSPVAGSMS